MNNWAGQRTRALVEWLGRLILRIFFRRIEIVGQENVPASGPVILAVNHPNGLVDPICILAHAPRKVSFLAKEPLFRTPVVKHFVKALECLPVYRKQDGADMHQNLKTLQAARELLAHGGVIALFPEGISHDQPQLQTLRTGAARIALGARSLMAGDNSRAASVQLVPAGLYYPSRGIFRSDVTLVYGTPLQVDVVPLDTSANPPQEAVKALTQQLSESLRALTVNAKDTELITLAATAARLIHETSIGSALDAESAPMKQRLELMQQILNGHEDLQRDDAGKAAALVNRLRRYEDLINRYGLGLSGTTRPNTGPALKHVMVSLVGFIALSPLIVPGIVENHLPYRLVGHLARRLAGDTEDTLSTLKVLAGMVLFPLTWLAYSLTIGWFTDARLAAVHLALAPALAWAALWFLDRAALTVSGARVLWLYWTQPARYAQLHREGLDIAKQLVSVNSH